MLFAFPPLNKNVRPFAADLRKLSGNTPWHPRKRPGTCVSTSQSRPTSTQGRRPSSESSGWVRTVWKCQWCWYSQSHPGTQRSCWGARRRAVCTGRSRAWFHRWAVWVVHSGERRTPRPAHRPSGQGRSAESTRVSWQTGYKSVRQLDRRHKA